MRRIYLNEVVLAIAALLIAAAFGFAWLRKDPGQQLAGPALRGPREQPPPAEEAERPFAWQLIGEQIYQARCASCHASGEGSRRVPPLHGGAVQLYLADGGRDYLIDFLLYGMVRRVEVNGTVRTARHPAYENRLSDPEIAAVLNHTLTSWGNEALLPDPARLYLPEDIAEQRDRSLTPEQVEALRPSLAD